MTLLIGTRSAKHLVVSADGLSVKKEGGRRRVSCSHLQKVFLFRDAAMAIAHHGENKIDGTPVETLLEPFLSIGSSSMPQHVVDRLTEHFDSLVRSTLSKIREADRCAFWVCGFTGRPAAPAITEIEWKKAGGSIQFNKQTPAGDLFMSGDGHDYISEYTETPIDGQFAWTKLRSANQEYHLRFHDKLWRIAVARQEERKEQLFGGHRHILVLRATRGEWARAPAQPNNAIDGSGVIAAE